MDTAKSHSADEPTGTGKGNAVGLPPAAEILAARTGHQLANLLTPLSGCLDLFRDDPGNAAEFAESLPLLIQIAHRMAIHIDDLLMCRRRPLTNKRPHALYDLLRQAVAAVQATGLAEGHELVLRNEPDDFKPVVQGDGRLLAHLFVNVLVNAVESMRQMGGVEIEIHPGGHGPVVSICDQGTGIASDLQQQVFEPFHSTKGSNSGMGLGLYVARLIADQHNAQIRLKQRLPLGLVVDIEFVESPAA